MDNQCLACKETFTTLAKLKKHIKKHNARIAEYYQTYLPRYDLYDGSLIKYKNEEFYLNSDFNSRTNVCLWLQKQSPEAAKAYCRERLLERKSRKGLVYAPTQAELKTIMLPGIRLFNQIVGDYNSFCAELGFKIRFERYAFDKPGNEIFRHKIIIDTREQKPLELSGKTDVKTLKYGDYAMLNREASGGLVIERKSANDFYGTMSAGFERFGREMQRARDDKAYMVVLVESTINDVIALPKTRMLIGRLNISPEFIFHRMREFIRQNDNVQFLFVDGREESARILKVLFSHADECPTTDLQYSYDTKQL